MTEPLQLNFAVYIAAPAKALVILLNATHARGQVVSRGITVELRGRHLVAVRISTGVVFFVNEILLIYLKGALVEVGSLAWVRIQHRQVARPVILFIDVVITECNCLERLLGVLQISSRGLLSSSGTVLHVKVHTLL